MRSARRSKPKSVKDACYRPPFVSSENIAQKHRRKRKQLCVVVGGMRGKRIRLADSIDIIATDEDEANENANSLNEHSPEAL